MTKAEINAEVEAARKQMRAPAKKASSRSRK
jgi:hypothetical protein